MTTAAAAPHLRQQVLQLWLHGPDLGSSVVAWSFYDGSVPRPADDDQQLKPPYPSALHAMRDGWRVVGIAPARPSVPGHEYRTSFLPHEIVLERLLEPTHV